MINKPSVGERMKQLKSMSPAQVRSLLLNIRDEGKPIATHQESISESFDLNIERILQYELSKGALVPDYKKQEGTGVREDPFAEVIKNIEQAKKDFCEDLDDIINDIKAISLKRNYVEEPKKSEPLQFPKQIINLVEELKKSGATVEVISMGEIPEGLFKPRG